MSDLVTMVSTGGAMWMSIEERTAGAIGLERITRIVGDDWGWWRTVTLSLARFRDFAIGDDPRLVPAGGAYQPVEQIERISRAVEEAPKSLQWKIRARVGERKRWYTLPDEDSHD